MRYVLVGLLLLLTGCSVTLPGYTGPQVPYKHPLGVDACGEGP